MKSAPLRRSSRTLTRSVRLGRAGALLRRKRREKPRMSLQTANVAAGRTRGRCACGCGRWATLGWEHHIFPKAKWPELVDDPRNVLAVNQHCHANHEAGSKRFTRKMVACAEPLATTPAMQRYLDRTYPREESP